MTLRETALKGGAHLVGREVAGLLIRFGGALIVTRLIGPSNFGLYAGALAIVGTLSTAAQIGGEVFLIRREEEPPRSTYDQVFTILIGSTTAAVALGLAGSLVVGAVIDSPEAVAAFQVLLLTLPLTVLWAPAQAKLERGFHFRSLAFLQVGSDAALYTVAATLAVAGAGVWAPVAGTYAASAFLLVGSYALAAYRPRIDLSRERVRELGRFGLEFTPAPLLWSSANLVNPLVVGASLGSASVGYVALATRLADTASFVSRATYRVSLVALSRVQSDPARLRRGFEEMVSLQAIGVGVPLVALAVVARPLLPVAFGHEWKPALEVLPFVSFGFLMLGIFSPHISLLYVLGRLRATSLTALARLVLLAVVAAALLPPLELYGFGIAVLVSTAAWVIADRAVRGQVEFRYGMAARWTAVLTPALFVPLVGPAGLVLLAPLGLMLLIDRDSRGQLRGYAGFVRRNIASRGAKDTGGGSD